MVAGNSAAANADALLYDSMAAFYTACGSFMDKITGAGKRKRVKNSYLISLAYSFGIGLVGRNLSCYFGRQFLGLFTNDAAVIDAGMKRLTIMGFSYGFSAFMDASIAASGLLKKLCAHYNCDPGFLRISNDLGEYGFAYFRTIPSLYLLYIFSWELQRLEIIFFYMCIRIRRSGLRRETCRRNVRIGYFEMEEDFQNLRQ